MKYKLFRVHGNEVGRRHPRQSKSTWALGPLGPRNPPQPAKRCTAAAQNLWKLLAGMKLFAARRAIVLQGSFPEPADIITAGELTYSTCGPLPSESLPLPAATSSITPRRSPQTPTKPLLLRSAADFAVNI